MRRMKKQVRYFSDFDKDFEQSANQSFVLDKDYKWVRTDLGSKLLSAAVYFFAVIFSYFYCRFFLHMKIRGREKLRKTKGGFFIYGNHTQPIGDVFIPAHAAIPKRIYTVVSAANYGIPVIGKVLPFLGALPIEGSLSGMKELNRAIEYRINNGNPIVIYPEAHVWEYYTDIRPFADTSFKFPVKLNRPAFSMTVTYKKSKIFKRPKAEVFIDGPFFPTGNSPKQKSENLCNTIYNTMKSRSKNSNYNYIEYIKSK